MSNKLLAATVELLNKKLSSLDSRISELKAASKGDKGDKGDKGEQGVAGKDGKDGRDGINGKDGVNGLQGIQGPKGQDGKDGRDGIDGTEAPYVVDAIIDIDSHLVLTMSDGRDIDAGDLTEAWLQSDKVVQIIRGGGPNTQQIKADVKELQDKANETDVEQSVQDNRLDTNEADIDALESRADETDTEQAIQDGRLDVLEDRADETDTEQATQNGRLDSLETRADANDVTNTQQNARLDTLETRVDETDTEQAIQDGRLDVLEDRADETDAEQVVQDNRLTANESDIDNLETRADETDAEQVVQDNRLDALESLELKRTPIETEFSATRTLDTTFIVDANRDAYVSYNLRVVAVLAASAAPISAVLEISADGTNFTTVAQAAQASTISLGGLLSINLLQDYTTQLAGMIPAGYTVRIRTVGQLPPANTITFSTGHETIFDIRYL